MSQKSTTTKHEIAKKETAAANNNDAAMHGAEVSKQRQPVRNPNKMTPGNKRAPVKGRY